MQNVRLAQDIITLHQFKTNAATILGNLTENRHPVVITRNGKPAAVVITPQEYDELSYRKEFIESVNRGLEDVKAGRVISDEELTKRLNERFG